MPAHACTTTDCRGASFGRSSILDWCQRKGCQGSDFAMFRRLCRNLLMPFSASRLGSCEPARFARLLVGFVLHCGTRSYSLVEEDARAPLTGHLFGCVVSLFESCRGYIYTLNRRLQQRANGTLDFFRRNSHDACWQTNLVCSGAGYGVVRGVPQRLIHL